MPCVTPHPQTEAARRIWADLLALARATLDAVARLRQTPRPALRDAYGPTTAHTVPLGVFLADLDALAWNVRAGLGAVSGEAMLDVLGLAAGRFAHVVEDEDGDGILTIHGDYGADADD